MRLDGIDILRGIAVIAVIMYHFFVLLGLTGYSVYPYIKTFGSMGVPLFFIISGYLIFRSVERNIDSKGIKKGLLNYFFHRLFRILPAYYFNLFVVILIASFVIGNDYFYSASFFRQIFTHLTFTNYFIYKSAGFEINGAYWTLGIEMLWYIVAPLLFIFFRKTRILVTIMLLSLLYIWSIDHGYLDNYFVLDEKSQNYRLLLYYYISQLPGQINYFIAGILIYKYSISLPMYSVRSKYLFASVTVLLFIGVMGYFNIYLAFLPTHLILLSVTAILFTLLYSARVKGFSFIEWIGKISYSLYLWHMPILFIMNKSHILEYRSLVDTTLFFLILLFTLSSMSYYFIEEGGFALRTRLTKRFFPEKIKEVDL